MTKSLLAFLAVLFVSGHWVQADTVSPELQGQIDAIHKEMIQWAAAPAIVKAVSTQNKGIPAEYVGMDETKWAALTVMDPLVRTLTKNEAALFLKTKRNELVEKIFLSDAAGCKVAFLAKTTNWCHKGKAKHEDPMAGKNWQGPVEVDQSTGLSMIQIAVPVLEDGKPIGSLVAGIKMSK